MHLPLYSLRPKKPKAAARSNGAVGRVVVLYCAKGSAMDPLTSAERRYCYNALHALDNYAKLYGRNKAISGRRIADNQDPVALSATLNTELQARADQKPTDRFRADDAKKAEALMRKVREVHPEALRETLIRTEEAIEYVG